MIEIDYTLVWVNFVSKLITVKKDGTNIKDKVKDYHPIVQFGLCYLGWNSDRDLFHHYSLGWKKDNPDFFLIKGGISIPIEVKLPSEVMNKADTERLFEQMRISKSNIGIYIGEHVRVFYRPSIKDELKVVIDAALTENDIEGFVFAELFYKPHFDVESLINELNILYKLERVMDDFNVTKLVSKEWIKDRCRKRVLL